MLLLKVDMWSSSRMGQWYGWSEGWVGCLSHRNLLLCGCLDHALATGVALVDNRIEAGRWMTNALVKREEESKGKYCSYKCRSWAMPSSLLRSYCARYGKVGAPEKFPWGETDAMKSQQTEKEFVSLGTGSDRGHQGEFGREEGLEKGVSRALGETKRSVGLWGWVWQDWGPAGLTAVAIPNGIWD